MTVSEANDAYLWDRVARAVRVFLTGLWRDNGLAGSSSQEAFYVRVGYGSSMTMNDILNGRMVCEVGVALTRPSEFVILRFVENVKHVQ